LKNPNKIDLDREEHEGQSSDLTKPLLENEYEEEIIMKFMYIFFFLA